MSDNWVVQNLQNALNVWNEKLGEIWTLITQSPQTFKGGAIWNVVSSIHGALQAIGYALLVLFFVIGMVKTCGSFAEVKKPEHAVKLFIRFAIAKGVITYGMELMMALLDIVQGVISTIMGAAGFGAPQETVLPNTIINAIEDCGFFESIPLWAVTLIGGLFIWVLSFLMILSVYGRFSKCICTRPLHRSLWHLSQESQVRTSAKAFSRVTPLCCWKALSSCLPVSSSPCSRPRRLWSIQTRLRPQWSGAISASSFSTCSFLWAA